MQISKNTLKQISEGVPVAHPCHLPDESDQSYFQAAHNLYAAIPQLTFPKPNPRRPIPSQKQEIKPQENPHTFDDEPDYDIVKLKTGKYKYTARKPLDWYEITRGKYAENLHSIDAILQILREKGFTDEDLEGLDM